MTLVEFIHQSTPAWLIIIAIIGLLVGSFLNVVIHRVPIMLERAWNEAPDTGSAFNLVVPRSCCPHCQHVIRAWENIPVLSYLCLRGRCSQCAKPISKRYPAVELLTAVLSVVVAWQLGPSGEAWAGLLLTWALIALAFIDLDHQLLPDIITLPLLWLGLLFSLFWSTHSIFAPTREAVIGAMAGYAVLWSVFQLFKLATGKEGMGFGDFKLLAALGAWLGWQQLPLVVFFAAAVGTVIGIAMIVSKHLQRETPIPFGPYLAAAGWIAMLWGTPIMNAYIATMVH